MIYNFSCSRGSCGLVIRSTLPVENQTPERLIGDTAYGAAPMLVWLSKRKPSNLMCRSGTSGRKDGTFSISDFESLKPAPAEVHDPCGDHLIICPGGRTSARARPQTGSRLAVQSCLGLQIASCLNARQTRMRNRIVPVLRRAHLAARPLAASGIPFSVPMGTRLPSG